VVEPLSRIHIEDMPRPVDFGLGFRFDPYFCSGCFRLRMLSACATASPPALTRCSMSSATGVP
jgi:hypothetical protein